MDANLMSINRGMDKKDVLHIYNGILLNLKKKKRNNAICSKWKCLEIIMLSEVSETEKEKYCMTPLLCRI